MPEALSDLIGAIYDCILDPDRWPQAIGAICGRIGCAQGAIIDIDPARSAHRFVSSWGVSPDRAARYLDRGEEVAAAYRAFCEVPGHRIDEPLLLSRDVPPPAALASRIYEGWLRPQQVRDWIQNIVLRAPGRIALFCAGRHQEAGIVTDDEIATLRLLAPHLRRAMAIGDLMDLKTLESRSLAADRYLGRL